MRSETFADHYSQARQFYVSQTPVEQQHIVDAFVFELSKVERPDIRARMVANLRTSTTTSATAVADGLGLEDAADPSVPARTPITDLAAVTGAQHPAERSRLVRGAQGRRARHRRDRRRGARRTVQGRRGARA